MSENQEMIQPKQHLSLNPGTLLAPVPVVLVSTRAADPDSGEEKDNLTTVAWTGIVNSDPPMIGLSVRPSRLAHESIQATNRFAVNLVSQELVKACDYCGVRSGRQHNKFRDMHLRTFRLASGLAGLQRSPLVLDCQVEQSLELGSHTLFLARIDDVLVRPDLMDDKGRLHLERAELVAYVHGDYYALGEMLGFFGFSVASEDVLARRMPRTAKKNPDQKKAHFKTNDKNYRKPSTKYPKKKRSE